MGIVVDEDHIRWNSETGADITVRTGAHFVDGLHAESVLVLGRQVLNDVTVLCQTYQIELLIPISDKIELYLNRCKSISSEVWNPVPS